MQNWDDDYSRQFYELEEEAQDAAGSKRSMVAMASGMIIAVIPISIFVFLKQDGGGGSDVLAESTEVVTDVVSTSSAVETEASIETEVNATEEENIEKSPYRKYGNYRAVTSVTSQGFAANVFSIFVSAYESSGDTDQDITVYSPARDRSYRMSCSGEEVVTCRGGTNAVVDIW